MEFYAINDGDFIREDAIGVQIVDGKMRFFVPTDDEERVLRFPPIGWKIVLAGVHIPTDLKTECVANGR
jgi:hypothetical protein